MGFPAFPAKLKILCKPYLNKKNPYAEFDVIVNGILNKKIKLNDDSKKIIEIVLNDQNDNEFKVDLKSGNIKVGDFDYTNKESITISK